MYKKTLDDSVKNNPEDVAFGLVEAALHTSLNMSRCYNMQYWEYCIVLKYTFPEFVQNAMKQVT